MIQSATTITAVFSEEQLNEQKQFREALQNGSAKIVFEGSFKDGIDFLQETEKLVDTCIHS